MHVPQEVDIVKVDGKRLRRRKVRPGDTVVKEARCKDWTDVTVAEMYVFLGNRITMGAHPRARERMYWGMTGDDGMATGESALLELPLKAAGDTPANMSFRASSSFSNPRLR